jgi:hypothetical protein
MNDHRSANWTRDAPADDQYVILGIDLQQAKRLRGTANVPHVACHFLAFFNAATRTAVGVTADTTRRPVLSLGTVGSSQTAEAMALHATSETLAFGRPRHVDKADLVFGKALDRQDIAQFHRPRLIQSKFANDLLGAYACVGGMADHWLGRPMRFYIAKAKLKGVVPVGFLPSDLQHDTGTCLNDSYRFRDAAFAENASHSEFCPNQSQSHAGFQARPPF